jgi:hypothetical protein
LIVPRHHLVSEGTRCAEPSTQHPAPRTQNPEL